MQSHASWVTGSLDQQLAQLASSCGLIRCQGERSLLGQLLLTPSSRMSWMISQGLVSLSVVWANRQITALVVGTVSAPFPDTGGRTWSHPAHMLLACRSKDWRCSGRVVWVELDIEELGEV